MIDKMEYFTTENKTRFGKMEIVENVKITIRDNEVYDLNSHPTNINSFRFVKLIEGILEEAKKGAEYVTTSQEIPLSEMSEDIKLNYIKIVANLHIHMNLNFKFKLAT